MSDKIFGKFHPIPSTIANQRWISIRNVIIYLESKFRPNQRIFCGHLVLGYHGNGRHFDFFLTPSKAATLWVGTSTVVVDIPTKFHEAWWKESKFFSQTDSDFFGLSRSTRCGCCSYQVSSISVRRVTCYDLFCVFQYFSILDVSMAMAAILKIPQVVSTSTHSALHSSEVSLISVQ